MTEGASRHRGPAIGVLGAAVAIASIWWFALRPRRQRDGSAVGASDLSGEAEG